MNTEGLRLTTAGKCAKCPAQVFAELRRQSGRRLCVECEETFIAALLRVASPDWPTGPGLRERSGGRLPAHVHCSEACCRGRRAA